MLMNRYEFALMNNPVRRFLQRHVEAPLLRRMGGGLDRGIALELGCGQGEGARLALEVFDYGIIHHVGSWRHEIAEVFRVLKPGGRFYAEEVLARFIEAPVVGSLLDHPSADRFNAATFLAAMKSVGLQPISHHQLWGLMAWFVAEKPAPAFRGRTGRDEGDRTTRPLRQ